MKSSVTVGRERDPRHRHCVSEYVANPAPGERHPDTLVIPNQSEEQGDHQPMGKDVSRPAMFYVAPESFVGGPLALIRTGDIIELDVPARSLNVRLSEDELTERRAAWVAPEARYERGYGKMYIQHVEQADKGCDFDFLRTDFGAAVPEPEIN